MTTDPSPPRPRVCVVTPEGRGALSVVRVWGRGALEVADAVFRPVRGASLSATKPERLRLGRMGAGLGDEVVAVVIDGDPLEVEVHCHGGPAPLALVVEALVAAGAERRQPVAWVRQASQSAVAAEADVDLARAPTVRTAEILLEQAQGALEGEARRLIALLPEDPSAALAGIETLLRRSKIGLRLISGWRVVLAGRPNVGKSRLFNALAGFERAIVDPTPGTTRDVVTVRTAFDGWPVELADTAGLRASDDAIEASGISRARAEQEDADLLLLVLDRSTPLTPADRELLEASRRALVVANKSDLPAAWSPGPEAVTTSAERGDGIETLAAVISRRLVSEPPPPGAGIPFRPGQVRLLAEAAQALQSGDPASAKSRLGRLLDPLPPRSERARPG